MKKTALILLTLLVFNLQNIFGQGYPVQTTMHISAPYSPLIEDYYAGVNPSMRLTALYKDFNSTTALPVRLQFTIESDKGFKITTNPNFVPTPINLNGGENYQISDAELSQYFTPQALTVVGNGADKFLRERRLPDGFYRFYVKINDYHRNITISNQAIAIAWIRLNEPPRWITPTNNATIPGTYPQNVMFTWMIQHVASPAGKSDVEYHFELFEAATNDISPEVIIRSQRPLYTDIINATSLIYSADKPILTPGKKYVCRIKAVDNQNYITFKNEGYTTPLVFIFGKECKPPYNIQTPEPTKTSVTLEWQSDYDNEPTQLQLRETGDNTSEWYTYKTNQTSIIIDKLSAGHPYEVQLRNVCDGAFSPWTAPKRFKTTPLGLTQNKKNCSAEEVHFPITNNEPLAELMVGEVIYVDGFPAAITSVEGSNGNFSGSCGLFVPFVGAKIQCTFKNITVTQSMQVSNGSIIAVRGPKVTFVGGGNSGGTGDDNGNGTGNGAGGAGNYQISGDTLQLNNGQTVDTVYVNNAGQIVIVDTNGNTIQTGKTNIVVNTGGGSGAGGSSTTNTYTVEDGKIVKTPGGGTTGGGTASGTGTANSLEENVRISFISPIDNQSTGGFDSPRYKQMINGGAYNTIQLNKQNYYIPWRSVEAGKSAFVVAEMAIISDTITTKNIEFVDANGLILSTSPAVGKAGSKSTFLKINLQAGNHQDVNRITAQYFRTDKDGKKHTTPLAYVNVISYNSQPVDLVIATTTGNTPKVSASELQTELNHIYSQSVIQFKVSQIDLGTVDFDKNKDNSVDAGETGIISNYTAETRAFKRAVRKHQAYNKKHFYIVMVPQAEKTDGRASLQGRWALKTQVGFVFNPSSMSRANFIRTVAHESGHGIFRLWHTFSANSKYIIPQGQTNNLMDYVADSTQLYKHQWDFCHDPESMTGLFQDDSEGEMKYDNELVTDIIQKIRCAYALNSRRIFIASNGFYVKGKITNPDIDITINLNPDKDKYDVYDLFDSYEISNTSENRIYKFGIKFEIRIPFDKTSTFESYIQNSDFSNEYSVVSGLLANGKISEGLAKLYSCSYCVYEKLSAIEKRRLLKELAEKTFLTENFEDMVLNLIRSSYRSKNSQEANEVLYSIFNIKAERTLFGVICDRRERTLFECFIEKMNDFNGRENYSLLIKELTNLVKIADDVNLKKAQNSVQVFKNFYFDQSNIYPWYDWSKSGGQVVKLFNERYSIKFGNKVIECIPTSIINVHFARDFDFIPNGGNRVIAMPAFALVYLLNHEQTALKMEVVENIITVYSLTTGIGKWMLLKNATKMQRVCVALNLVKESAYIILDNNEVRTFIKKKWKDDGESFLLFFDNISRLDLSFTTAKSMVYSSSFIKLLDANINTWSVICEDQEINKELSEDIILSITTKLQELKNSMNDEDIIY